MGAMLTAAYLEPWKLIRGLAGFHSKRHDESRQTAVLRKDEGGEGLRGTAAREGAGECS